jgi:ubiquinone/menaquinone biosynthesis C-methylase UbiE
MNLYERWILPPILDLTMRQKHLTKYRRAVVAAAHGRVLEIGVGSGLNLPLYGKQVELVYGIDPSPRLLAIARRRAAASGVPVELLQGSATAIPLANSSVDTVVMTWTLCSIPDPLAALREMRRVLKPNGKLCFVEHGLSPEPNIEHWQHLDELISLAGFDLMNLHGENAPGPRTMSYMYEGCACRGNSQGVPSAGALLPPTSME